MYRTIRTRVYVGIDSRFFKKDRVWFVIPLVLLTVPSPQPAMYSLALFLRIALHLRYSASPNSNRSPTSMPSSIRNRSQSASNLIARQKGQECGRQLVLHWSERYRKNVYPAICDSPSMPFGTDGSFSSNRIALAAVISFTAASSIRFMMSMYSFRHSGSQLIIFPRASQRHTSTVMPCVTPCSRIGTTGGHSSASGICGNPCCFSYAKRSIPPPMRCLRVAAESSEHLQFLCGGKDRCDPCR